MQWWERVGAGEHMCDAVVDEGKCMCVTVEDEGRAGGHMCGLGWGQMW